MSDLNYKSAIEELESIVQKIEGAENDLDEVQTLVQRATELIEFCQGKLHDTQQELDKAFQKLDPEE